MAGRNANVILEKSGIKIYVGAADITAKEGIDGVSKLRLFEALKLRESIIKTV